MDKINELKQHWVDNFLIGSVWENDKRYKVKILDYGLNSVWLLYFENRNRCAWDIEKFIQEYKPSFEF